MQNIKS